MLTIRKKAIPFSLLQRALLTLCLASLFGCSSPKSRQWEIQEIITQSPCFNAVKLILGPDSNYSYLELELTRTLSGIRFYINLLFLEALPLKEDCTRTSIVIQFEDQNSWTIYPYLLQGGQRLLLPTDIANQLIDALLDERMFTIQVGRNVIEVTPNHFKEHYTRLLNLPIG